MFHTISTESIHFPVSAHTPTHLSQPFHLSQPLSAVHPPFSAPLYLSQPVSVHMSVCFSPSLPWYLIYLSHTYPSLFQRSTPPSYFLLVCRSSCTSLSCRFVHSPSFACMGVHTPMLHIYTQILFCSVYLYAPHVPVCWYAVHLFLPPTPFPPVHTYLPTTLT